VVGDGGIRAQGHESLCVGPRQRVAAACELARHDRASWLGAHGFAQVHDHATFLLPAAHSGTQVGTLGASLQFAGDVDRVGVWLYTHNGTQYLNVLDAQQHVLGSLAADPRRADASFFDFVGLRSDSHDIRYVVIANKDLSADPHWDVGGLTTFYDDLMFFAPSTVPEPQAAALLLAGLLLVGARAARRR